MKTIVTIKIIMNDKNEDDPEDVVKRMWGYFYPWFTVRHEQKEGSIKYGKGVRIKWNYREVDSENCST